MKPIDPSNITSITDRAKQAVEKQNQGEVAGLPPELLEQLSPTYIKKITPVEENPIQKAIREAMTDLATAEIAVNDTADTLYTLDDILVETWKATEEVFKRDKARTAIKALVKRGVLVKGEGKNSGWRVVVEQIEPDNKP